MARRELGRDQATERVPGDVDTLQADRVEPPHEPPAQVGRPDMAQPPEIDDVNLTARAERLDHRRPPAPRAGEPVHEHERLAAPGDAVRKGPAVDADLSSLNHVAERCQPRRSGRDARRA